MARKKQQTMSGKGFDQDEAGRVGLEIIGCNNRIKEAMEERGDHEKELAAILKKEGRDHFKITDPDTDESYTLILDHVVKDKIRVRKSKVKEIEGGDGTL